MELNTVQLLDIIKRDRHSRRFFIGVFSRDRLPLRINYPCCFILNTHKSNQPGEHWLAVFVDDQQKAEFFDSYGNPPSHFKLDKYLKQVSKSYSFNHVQLQSFSTKLCGYYCALFLLYRSKGFTLDELIQKLSKNTHLNDFIVLNLIKT